MAAWVGTKRPDSLASWRLPYARVVNDEPRANRNARNYFLIRPTGPNPTLITRRRVLRPSPPGFKSCMECIVTQGERCVFPLRAQAAGRFRSLKIRNLVLHCEQSAKIAAITPFVMKWIAISMFMFNELETISG